jgi:hypothetical protein
MPPLQTPPSNQAVPSSQDPATDSGKPDHPVCPTCQGAMTVKLVMPLMSAIGVDETVYTCGACSTETHRTAKRR